ncbi:MAG: histidine kinase [Flavobacteriales bacterium]|nr:histidine kinase [Flavobacteriales bacterium]MCB9168508.1 histidine kinase [Flavobacteriales bacterium]
MIRRSLGLLLGAILVCHVQAQYPYVKSFHLQNGNLRPDVQCLAIDAHGIIWAGGAHGLFRSDGERTDPALAGAMDAVSAVASFGDGVVAAFRSGAVLAFTGFRADTLLMDTVLSRSAVHAMAAAGDSVVWLGTYGAGLWRWSRGGTRRITMTDGLNDDHVNAIQVLADGGPVVGTDLGIALCSSEGGIERKLREEEGATDNLVLALALDAEARVWAGTDRNGVFRFEPEAPSFNVLALDSTWSSGPVTGLVLENSMVWAATAAEGVRVYDLRAGIGSYAPDRDGEMERVRGITHGPDGSVWWCDGTNTLRRGDPDVLVVPGHEDRDLRHITALCSDDRGRIWFAIGDQVFHHAAAFADAEHLAEIRLPLRPEVRIVTLQADRWGSIWVGTFGDGVFRLMPDGAITRLTHANGLANDNILSIRADGNVLWMATLAGVSVVDLLADGSVAEARALATPGSGFLYDILPTPDGGAIAASDGNGAIRFAGPKAEGHIMATGPTSGRQSYYSLCRDARGGLWGCGPGTGLCLIGDSSIHCTGRDSPVLEGDVYAMAPYRGRIIALGDQGVVALDVRENVLVDLSDVMGTVGAVGELNAVCVDREQALWVATDKGLVRLRPREEVLRGQVPTAIVGWRWGDEVLPMTPGIRLNDDQNFLTFQFTGTPTAAPERLRFEYRLVGYDRRTLSTREREVSYARLPPGDYRFEVRATLGQNAAGDAPATLAFTIAHPWWRTYWAMALWIVLLTVLFYAFIRLREERLRYRDRMERERVRLQLQAVRSQVNPHFLFNSFNTLMELIEEDRDKALAHVGELSEFFRNILHVRDKDLITVEEELQLLYTYFGLERRRFGERIGLEVELDDTVKATWLPPLTLQMLVENALKHNVATREMPLVVTIRSEQERILVCNPDRPRSTQQPSTGYGLESIRKRYADITGDPIEVGRQDGAFCVRLPLVHQHP